MIKIPSYGRETFNSVDNTVHWFLHDYVKVKGYQHNVSSRGGQIYVIKPPVSNKEVVREVVLIPCAYCSGLMPQTSTVCPSWEHEKRLEMREVLDLNSVELA